MKVVNAIHLKPNHKYFANCAEIHSEQIPGGFLPTLGIDFLASLYEVFAKSRHSFLLMAVIDDNVIGFIAISLDTRKFFKHYIFKNVLKTLIKIPLRVFGKVFVAKSLDLVKYFTQNNRIKNNFISNSEVFNFCVDKRFQGTGVGQLIFSSALDKLLENKVVFLKIVTGASQIGAQSFYRKSGAELSHREIVHQGRGSLVYKLKIHGK